MYISFLSEREYHVEKNHLLFDHIWQQIGVAFFSHLKAKAQRWPYILRLFVMVKVTAKERERGEKKEVCLLSYHLFSPGNKLRFEHYSFYPDWKKQKKRESKKKFSLIVWGFFSWSMNKALPATWMARLFRNTHRSQVDHFLSFPFSTISTLSLISSIYFLYIQIEGKNFSLFLSFSRIRLYIYQRIQPLKHKQLKERMSRI